MEGLLEEGLWKAQRCHNLPSMLERKTLGVCPHNLEESDLNFGKMDFVSATQLFNLHSSGGSLNGPDLFKV